MQLNQDVFGILWKLRFSGIEIQDSLLNMWKINNHSH